MLGASMDAGWWVNVSRTVRRVNLDLQSLYDLICTCFHSDDMMIMSPFRHPTHSCLLTTAQSRGHLSVSMFTV